MQGTMKVAAMEQVGKIVFLERPIPTPREDEVLVKLEYVGVCGSDLHYYEHGSMTGFVPNFPFVLGHESGGTVVEVGAAVTHLQPGDKVALEPGKTCGRCEFCKEGKYNLCPDVIFFAAAPVDGVFQEYVAHQADLCFKLPPNMTAMEGALIEPLAVGLHAVTQGGAHIGQTALVFGSGCIGLVSLLSLIAAGVSNICVVDVLDKRLAKAKELGATKIINAKETDVLAELDAWTKGRGCDIVIETAGTERTMQQSVYAAKKGGTVVFVGYSGADLVPFPVNEVLNRELTLKSVFRYRNNYAMAIEAVSSGKVDVKGIVTDYFAFDDMQNALDRCVKDKADIVKAVINICDYSKSRK